MNSQPVEFRDDELYIFVVDPKDVMIAHAGDAERIGVSSTDSFDSSGRNLGVMLRSEARPDGTWVSYEFMNVASGRIEAKTTWVRLVDGYLFGAGIYQPL
jgi:signal transduction histidine kinase